MIIYGYLGVPIAHLDVDDTSYRYREIMGDSRVYLEFSLTQHVELGIGSYVDFQGERYELMSKPDVAIQHNRDYFYKVTFEGQQSRFKKYVVHNPVDGRLVFPMIATPAEHLAMLVANLTGREGQVQNPWTVGTCIGGPQKEMQYNHTKLSDALTALANLYDTEWEVVGKAIHLRKVEYNTDDPLALGYGRNTGFKAGVGSSSYGETGQVQRVFIQGSDRNISLKEYGSSTLLLPKDLHFQFDGEHFRYPYGQGYVEETGFNSSKAVQMKTDANGFSVMLENAPAACNEESLDVTAVYPKRVGKVTGVRYLYNHQYLTYAELMALAEPPTGDDWLNVQVDIIDSEIPAILDYDACQLQNGEPMVVIFQTGMLAGREFDVKKFHKTAVTQATASNQAEERPANRFELVRATFNDIDMPNATYRPNADSRADTSDEYKDTYIVVNCYLPQSYVSDIENCGGAEFDALRQASKFLFEHKDIQVTFKGTIDDLFSKRNWLNVGSKLKLGGTISFQNASIQPQALVTRIVAVKDYINDPYSPEVTLSNEAVKGGLSSRIAQLGSETARVLNRTYALERTSRRSFRDAKETMEMLEEALLEGFTDRISPIAVQTMQLLLGDESLQFRFVNAKTNPQQVAAGISYNPTTKKLSCNAAILQHMTLGINTVSSSHADSEYLFWDMAAFESAFLGDALASKRYYLYAKVDALNNGSAHNTGVYVLSETAIGMNSALVKSGNTITGGYYHLLVGALNSEQDNDRSFVTLFGFTEVLPGRITTEKIASPDGATLWDLVQKTLILGNLFKFNENGNGKLILNGALVQTGEEGEAVPIGAWCGQYDSNRTYKFGDECWNSVNGVVSTYRYVNADPHKGIEPGVANNWQTYWIVSASGVKGDDGTNGKHTTVVHLYKRAASAPSIDWNNELTYSFETNSLTSTPSGWSQSIPADNGLPLYVTAATASSNTATDKIAANEWATPVKYVEDGLNSATVTLYQRAASAPAKPAGTLTYTFATGVLSGTSANFNGWTQAIPATDGNPLYVIQATAISTTDTDDIASSEWSGVTKMVEDGTDGSDGRGISDTQIAYGVSSQSNVQPSVWQDTVPATMPGYYLWTRTTIIYTSGDPKVMYTVSYMSQDGSDGSDGSDGTNGYSTRFLYKSQAEKPLTPTGTSPSPTGWSEDHTPDKVAMGSTLDDVTKTYSGNWNNTNVGLAVLFKRASSAPSVDWDGSLTFSFSSGRLTSTPDGWSQSIPEGSGDLYVTWALVISASGSASVAAAAWSTPALHSSSGLNVNAPYQLKSAMKSDAITHDETTLEKMFFQTTRDNVYVTVDLIVGSEAGYDCLYMGYLDQSLFIDPEGQTHVSNYEHALASTSGFSGVPKVFSFTMLVKKAGYHRLEFAYSKDQSQSNTDLACFKLSEAYYEQKVWMTSCKVQDGVASNWTTPICINGVDGVNGSDGPACPYRGVYDPNATYFGTNTRTDIVRYTSNGSTRYYRANPCVGGPFSGIAPTNMAYWMDFGGQFSNIATGFLFAERAVIENAVVRMLESSEYGKRITVNENQLELFDVNDVQRMLITGESIDVGTPSSSYSTNHRGDSRSYSQQGGSGQDSFSFDICTFTVPPDGASVSFPSIGVLLSIDQQYYGGSIDRGVIDVSIVKNGYSYSLLNDDFSGGSGAQHISSSARTLSMNAGTYTVRVTISYEWSVDYEPPYYNSIGILAQDETSGNILIQSSASQIIMIGANGIAIHLGNNFSAIFAQDSGSPLIVLQGINSSNQAIGLKITAANGVQINRGSGWTAL